MAVLSWNEILQKDKQTQMTGAQGLSPEQLGALRSAELTEGSVNARNIFNQNEINRRNAVAEKQASDMLSAQQRAQNFESVVKLGMMAKDYYPEIKSAVTGAYDYVTGAKSAVTPYSTDSISTALTQETGTGGGVSLAGSVGSGATSYAPIANYAAGAEGAGTAISTLGSGELAAGTMTGDAGVSAASSGASAAGSGAMSTVGSVVGTVGLYAAAAQAGGYLMEQAAGEGGSNVFSKVGRSLQSPYLGGASLARETGSDLLVDLERIHNPLGQVFKAAGCIIVTACTDRNSYEVEVTRQYRDKYLTQTQLRGYYWAAEKLVPTIENNMTVRTLVKKHLVDRLVDYGEMKLGLKDNCKLSSKIVSNLFLGLIKTVGIIIPEYTRLNGEVY